ncbi:MAG TPA: class I tRNA ligase family protein, partial [Patescibacteria group bacterium]|nr:class I tRNA ligase family protein [Patescibacteria group bacterium]
MLKELPKIYQPEKYEDSIYRTWEASGLFNPDKLPGKRKKNYSIVLPLPNVTGQLHLGHASMLSYQDILIRYHRLKGDKTLWLPGMDHAAIATQSVVEKKLNQAGQTRHDLGRVKFLGMVDQFAEESKVIIRKQLKKMGSSLDWSREKFTLDEDLSGTVRYVFKKMHDDGLIYRGSRVVNWCPKCQSTLA